MTVYILLRDWFCFVWFASLSDFVLRMLERVECEDASMLSYHFISVQDAVQSCVPV